MSDAAKSLPEIYDRIIGQLRSENTYSVDDIIQGRVIIPREHGIYQWIDKTSRDVVYIGKTEDQDGLNTRINTHLKSNKSTLVNTIRVKEGLASKDEARKFMKERLLLQFICCPLLESYYLRKCPTKYNIQNNNHGTTKGNSAKSRSRADDFADQFKGKFDQSIWDAALSSKVYYLSNDYPIRISNDNIELINTNRSMKRKTFINNIICKMAEMDVGSAAGKRYLKEFITIILKNKLMADIKSQILNAQNRNPQ